MNIGLQYGDAVLHA